jgi:hypothetical protein
MRSLRIAVLIAVGFVAGCGQGTGGGGSAPGGTDDVQTRLIEGLKLSELNLSSEGPDSWSGQGITMTGQDITIKVRREGSRLVYEGTNPRGPINGSMELSPSAPGPK